ncbi:MAG: M23 family metallopeptidase [Nocardioides sp.]
MGDHRAARRGPRRSSVTHDVPDARPNGAGKRRAARHSGSRGSLFRLLPPAPILLGVAALSVAAGGAVTAADPDLLELGGSARVAHASALTGASGVARTNLLDDRTAAVSRDSRRDALQDAASQELVAAAEAQAKQRNAALAQFAKQAEAQAKKIALNQWVLPLDNYSISAEFGDWGLWASYHTGLDFNGNEGDPIKAVANGEVTDVGYDGSYGNKTVVTLDDGTELWYCHQSAYGVNVGDVVRAGEVLGYVGSTGNSTGSHLHLEVRPGGGDPVDPYEAFLVHGVQP